MDRHMIIRQIHRWASIIFAAIVAAIFAALGLGSEPANWVYFLPLPPLGILMFTGLWMFFLPYVGRQRSAQ